VLPRNSSAQVPAPAWTHGLELLSASRRARALPRQEPQQLQPGELQSPAPGEGQCQATAVRRAALLESSQGMVAMLPPSSTGFLPAPPGPASGLAFLLPCLERTHLWQTAAVSALRSLTTPAHHVLSAGLSPAQNPSAARGLHRKGSASSPCSLGLLLHGTPSAAKLATQDGEGQKLAAGFGNKS